MKKINQFLFLIISLMSVNVQAFSQACSDCSQSEIEILQEINTKYLGVSFSNPSVPSTYNLIGDNKFAGWTWHEVYGVFLQNNWYPIRTEKQTLVGTLKHFGVANFGDESDWNIVILPDPGFESFISEALLHKCDNWYAEGPLESKDEWYYSEDGKPMIEAEITPVSNVFNNPWFNNVTNKTYLKNKRIGVYGPFVYEESHGCRPEIHPSEVIWWKENEKTTMILLGIDASNRFDEMSDYEVYSDAVDGYKPWTTDKGQKAVIKIPFEINPNQGSLAFSIHAVIDHEFNTSSNYPDASGGTKQTVTCSGREVVTVIESSSIDNFIGVTFENICYNNQVVQGYIVLKTAIGNGGGGKEGFVALQIDKEQFGLNEKPGILAGNIINGANEWVPLSLSNTQALYSIYDDNIPFSDIISSDKKGKGVVDGMMDFDGNGKTDLFATKGNKWMVLFDGKGQWQEINTASVPSKELRFGDVNGDGRTDILHVRGERLFVSFSGTSRWDDYSHVEGLTASTIRVGDFNGDNKTDIIKRVDRYEISTDYAQIDLEIKYGCRGPWRTLESGFQVHDGDWEQRMRFGNFNGDGITDIFRYDQGKFQVYWSGRGYIKELCTPLIHDIDADDLLFVDNLSRNGYTDIIYNKKSTDAWKIYYEGKTSSSGRILKYNDPSIVHFGNVDGDALWEPFAIGPVKAPISSADLVLTNVPKVKMEPFVLSKYEQGSLKRSESDGKPILTMNMNLHYYTGSANAIVKKEHFQNITSVRDKAKALQYRPNANAMATGEQVLGKIENIPFSADENEMEVKFSGILNPVKYKVQPYSIGAMPNKIIETPGRAGKWAIWKSYLVPTINPQYASLLNKPLGIVEKIKSVEFDLLPFYALLEKGRVNIVEMDDMMKEMNEIAYGNDSAKIQEIFGDNNPFAIKWTFELKNISTGQTLQIANPNIIATDGKWTKSKISFTFPVNTNLLQFKAIAHITDKLGNKLITPLEFMFYNQRIKVSRPKQQLKTWLEPMQNVKIHKTLISKGNHLLKDKFLSPTELSNLLK